MKKNLIIITALLALFSNIANAQKGAKVEPTYVSATAKVDKYYTEEELQKFGKDFSKEFQRQIESKHVFGLRSPAPGPLVCSKRVATSAGGVCVILELPCNCRMVPVWVHFRSTPWMDRWPDDVVFRVALGPVYR